MDIYCMVEWLQVSSEYRSHSPKSRMSLNILDWKYSVFNWVHELTLNIMQLQIKDANMFVFHLFLSVQIWNRQSKCAQSHIFSFPKPQLLLIYNYNYRIENSKHERRAYVMALLCTFNWIVIVIYWSENQSFVCRIIFFVLLFCFSSFLFFWFNRTVISFRTHTREQFHMGWAWCDSFTFALHVNTMSSAVCRMHWTQMGAASEAQC